VIDANHPRCKIPIEYAEGGEIVFNISSAAVRDLKITNEFIEFKASFSGVIYLISAPIKAVLAIYAEENGEGIFFDAEEDDGDGATSTEPMVQLKGLDNHSLGLSDRIDVSSKPVSKSKPYLKLVE
jgi:stringent starvation protein B